MTDAADPADIAEAALRAVRANEFWAVTDDEIGPRLAAHLAPILGREPAAGPAVRPSRAPAAGPRSP
jgi:hypothetical protein